MNIFSNVGITELVLILLLALLVVGPERLPELAQQLGKLLRDVRKMYENLTSDLGPELMSLQETTQDLRDSVESVRSIPKDMVQQVVQAAELDDTMGELQSVKDSVDQHGPSDQKRFAPRLMNIYRFGIAKLGYGFFKGPSIFQRSIYIIIIAAA